MYVPATTERLLAEQRRAYELVEGREPGEAVKVYRQVLAEARKVGLDSAHLHWALAVACDYAGEVEMAFEELLVALEKDPLAPPFRHSFEVVAGRLRAALADPARAADDPSTPRLYALLQRTGDADVAAHAAMVRHHLATGKPTEARALAEALVLLHPAAPVAWEAAAAVAAAGGDAALAERARVEAAALAAAPLAFAVPGRASA